MGFYMQPIAFLETLPHSTSRAQIALFSYTYRPSLMRHNATSPPHPFFHQFDTQNTKKKREKVEMFQIICLVYSLFFYRKQDIQFLDGSGNPNYNSTYLSIGAPHGTGDNINFRGQCNTMYADGHAAGFMWKQVKNKYYAPDAYQDIAGNVWDADMWE